MGWLIAFLVFGVSAYGTFSSLAAGAWSDAGLFGAMALILFVFGVATVAAILQTEKLVLWYNERRDSIVAGDSVELHGEAVDADTRIARYRAVLSLVIFTLTTSSPVFVGRTTFVEWLYRLGYSAFTLVFGWWSIRGLMSTPMVVGQNLLGTSATTLGDLGTGFATGIAGLSAGSFPEFADPSLNDDDL